MISTEQQIEKDKEFIDKNIQLKECKHCKMPINFAAKVCHNCNKNQNYIWFYLDKFTIAGSIILVLLASLQYYEARQKNIQANEALKEAKEAKSKVSEFDKIIVESQRRLEVLKTITDKASIDAEETKRKVGEINKIIVKSQESLEVLRNHTEFIGILLAAQNDDWKAYVRLLKFSQDSSHSLSKVALNAIVKIRTQFAGPINPGYLKISWNKVDPNKLSFSKLKKVYYKLKPELHADLVKYIRKRKDISNLEKMSFFIEVIETSNSLNAKHYAATYFIKAANDDSLEWDPFKIDPLLDWWDKNKSKFH